MYPRQIVLSSVASLADLYDMGTWGAYVKMFSPAQKVSALKDGRRRKNVRYPEQSR
jgi:hypothetical protein